MHTIQNNGIVEQQNKQKILSTFKFIALQLTNVISSFGNGKFTYSVLKIFFYFAIPVFFVLLTQLLTYKLLFFCLVD